MSNRWPVIGHDWAVAFLQRALASGRPAHALLFLGAGGLGKRQLAIAYVMARNCQAAAGERPCQQCRNCRHIRDETSADIFFTRTSGASETLTIEEIRRVSAFFALQPYEMRLRVAILDDFERTAPIAQDALLKTLEEPPRYASLILLARDESAILPTIISRCQVLRLRPSQPEELAEQLTAEYSAEPERARQLADISGGRPGWAIRALREPALLAERETAIATLEQCLQQDFAARFALAERLAKDKSAFAAALDWWLAYWRDLILLSVDAGRTPSQSDRAPALRQLAHHFSANQIERAIRATRALREKLPLNLNLRLAIEALLLTYPRAPH